MLLGVVGGVLGAVLIQLNVSAAIYRRHTQIQQWPLLEVAAVTAITAVVSAIVSLFVHIQDDGILIRKTIDPIHEVSRSVHSTRARISALE